MLENNSKMATFTNKKMLKIEKTTISLALQAWEMIPKPHLDAMVNALKCEMETAKIMPTIEEVKKKVLEKKKSRTKRIKFGIVNEHSRAGIKKKPISFETKLNEMQTCYLVDHFPSAIIELTSRGVPEKQAKQEAHGIVNLFTNSSMWGPRMIGSTHESLVQEAGFANISMETIGKDLAKIYKYMRQETKAILGYKTSYKMPYKEKDYVYNQYKKCWEWTGNWILLAPKVRLYIIRVVKDKNFCATLIQTVWRQRRDKKFLMVLKGFSYLIKFISPQEKSQTFFK